MKIQGHPASVPACLAFLSCLLLPGCAFNPASTADEDQAQVMATPTDTPEVIDARRVLLIELERTPLVRHLTYNLTPGEPRSISYTDPDTDEKKAIDLILVLPGSIKASFSPGNSFTYPAWKVSYTDYVEHHDYFYLSSSWTQADAKEVVRTMKILVLDARHDMDQQFAANFEKFKQTCQGWRAMKDKPPMPEEAQQHKALAEAALQKNDPDTAGDEYLAALRLYPCWPEGLYRRGNILGQTGWYLAAVDEMRRYLLLVPDATDAQTIRANMQSWQGLMNR